jgi:hypothetical protein
MRLNRISLSAIKRLYLEQERLKEQAMMEIEDPNARTLGTMRLDLIAECQRRLLFLRYMLKDAEEHANERHRRNGSD